MNKRLTLLFIFLFFVSAEIIAQDIISTVVWDTPLEKDKFSRLIKVKEGDEFSIKNIRRTVKLLYATKKFEQIAVMLEKEKNGVKLILKGSPQLIITDISIKGNSKFSDRQLKSASGTGKNTYFFTSDLERIRDEIIYFYRENGFFNTLVNIATEKTGENSISLKIVIIEGVQEKINEIRIYGSMNKSEKRKLEYELGVSFKGNPNADKNINDINEFINTYFKDRGYLDVNVNTDRLPGGKVSFSINKGLLYILDITGDESFSPDTLKTIITGLSNYHFDAEGIKRKLLIFYQAYGFPDAVIDVDISDLSLRKNDQTRTISVNIDEGERRLINDIVFTGGSSFNRNVVVNRLKDFIEKKIEEENFPQIKITRSQTGGGYKDTDNERVKALKRSKKDKVMLPDSPLGIPEAYLEDIKEIVEKVYLNEGYMDISVLSAEIIDNSEGLYLLVGVKENTRFMLTGVTATTGDPVLDRIMKKKILLPRSIPFNENIVEAYRKRIKEFLSSKGYIFAHITHDLEYDGQKILLKFKAEYLFPVKVTEVVIAGNFITEEWAVKGALRIRPGDTLKGDTFQYRRRDLLQTGMYQSVMINFIDPEFPSEEKDVVVVVSEVERFKISPGIGISSDEGGRIFGSAEWRNFGGSGFSTKFSFKISRKIELFMGDEFKKYYSSDFTLFEQFERKFNLAFLFPDLYLPFLPLSAQVEAFHIHDIRSNAGLPYMIDKNGMYFSFFRRFSNNYFLSTGVEIAYQNERDHELDEAGDVYYNNIERLVISPEFRGYIDFRDSLFFPTKGYKTFFKYANKTSVYGEATSISYFENNLSLYIPLRYRMNFAGELEPKDTLIYHAFIETAFLIQHSGDLTSDDVLKLGGNTTIRGFFNDELQPNDLENEKSAEGRYSFVMRNELRFKLIESFYLISFFDMGNLWQKLGNIGDGSLFRYTAGGGLTYASPIGALTAQVGFNIRPRENEGIWAFHIYLSTF
ncbi:MAG TPA: POTRA domain-containing protein [bacterium]|nr:POTRA domain-containing protein [bacterium]